MGYEEGCNVRILIQRHNFSAVHGWWWFSSTSEGDIFYCFAFLFLNQHFIPLIARHVLLCNSCNSSFLFSFQQSLLYCHERLKCMIPPASLKASCPTANPNSFRRRHWCSGSEVTVEIISGLKVQPASLKAPGGSTLLSSCHKASCQQGLLSPDGLRRARNPHCPFVRHLGRSSCLSVDLPPKQGCYGMWRLLAL